ncbi:MAG: hypothetical protein GX801_07750 [Fibrobacter sp.]|nr:hypothetical protein [Fibrobacter sp.]
MLAIDDHFNPSIDFGTFTDIRDSNVYKTVQIGDQTWMAENLRYLPSLNGFANNDVHPRYYVYGYNSDQVSDAKNTYNYQFFGALYNWSAALTACPTGWHLPTIDEWDILIDYVGDSDDAGQKLMAISGWDSNHNAIDEYGFGALPGGDFIVTGFSDVSDCGYWWTASKYDMFYAHFIYIHDDSSAVSWTKDLKNHGHSVRCVKD